MAIYHLSAKVITRSTGASVVAAAAYRSGTKLKNDYDGTTHDFTRKKNIIFSQILLPENAPSSYLDRSDLWNAVELTERNRNSRLAREIEVSLPVELDFKNQVQLVKDFCQYNFVDKGMCCDINIHNPPVMDDLHRPLDQNGNITNDTSKMIFQNPHAHILLTIRPIDENGNWQQKSQVEYVCKGPTDERNLTALELALPENNCYAKQYKYKKDGKNVWLTAAEADALSLNSTRVSRAPRTTKGGRPNPISAEWDSQNSLLGWRKSWECHVNKYLSENHFQARVDCRSYADQGIEALPSIHLGAAAVNIERRAVRLQREHAPSALIIHSEKAEINKQIKLYNRLVIVIRSAAHSAILAAKKYSKSVQSYISKLSPNLPPLYSPQSIIESRHHSTSHRSR